MFPPVVLRDGSGFDRKLWYAGLNVEVPMESRGGRLDEGSVQPEALAGGDSGCPLTTVLEHLREAALAVVDFGAGPTWVLTLGSSCIGRGPRPTRLSK